MFKSIFSLILSVGLSYAALASTIHVPTQQPTIQTGIDAAIDGDTVLVGSGVYAGAGNRDIDFGGKKIVVVSVKGADSTLIDCGGSPTEPHRGFIFKYGETVVSVLSGFTITNGFADTGYSNVNLPSEGPAGGAIAVVVPSHPTIKNCKFENNISPGRASALFVYATDLSVDSCVFQFNQSPDSGGAVYFRGGIGNLENCVIASNSAGVFASVGTVTLNSCRVVANSSSGLGLKDGSRLNAISCVVDSNGTGFIGFDGLFAVRKTSLSHNVYAGIKSANYVVVWADTCAINYNGSGIVGGALEGHFNDCEVDSNIGPGLTLDMPVNLTLLNTNFNANRNLNFGPISYGDLNVVGCSMVSVDTIAFGGTTHFVNTLVKDAVFRELSESITMTFDSCILSNFPIGGYLGSVTDFTFRKCIIRDCDQFAISPECTGCCGPYCKLTIEGCAFLNNAGGVNALQLQSLNSNSVSISNTLFASCGIGIRDSAHIAQLSCNLVFANTIDYDGISDQTGLNGNIRMNPRLCDTSTLGYSLWSDSPCLPTHNSCATLIGVSSNVCPNVAPTAPELISPPDSSGIPVIDLKPVFDWSASFDPDPLDSIRYRLDLSLNSIFQAYVGYDSITADSIAAPDSLEFGTRYWWRVRATDKSGLFAVSNPSKSFWTWQLGDLDNSHTCDIADLSRLIDYLYISFLPINPLKLADVDGDCRVDISDLSAMIDYLYISFRPLEVGCEQ